ncbi:ABC transporter permease, partial [Candidatus Acetothermia bacterium]|nr:ABC transporter permease [Candidatus Acetothermia bacterium]
MLRPYKGKIMLNYIVRRLLYTIPTLLAISFVSFSVIHLAPGNFLTAQCAFNAQADLERCKTEAVRLGLDKPWYMRYWLWLEGILFKWDWGYSFENHRPVFDLILERLPITLLVTIPTFIFIWIVALPLGIYTSTHQYSLGDHTLTFFGFLGLSIPAFFFAYLLMYILVIYFGIVSVGGLFSQRFISAPWSWDRFVDYLQHLWPIVVVVGGSAVAGLMRIMRGQMLDITGSQYIKTARAKGLQERKVIYKHAVRNAINPMITIFGQSLNGLLSGSLITAIVLNIPNVERLLYEAILQKDDLVIMACLMLLA